MEALIIRTMTSPFESSHSYRSWLIQEKSLSAATPCLWRSRMTSRACTSMTIRADSVLRSSLDSLPRTFPTILRRFSVQRSAYSFSSPLPMASATSEVQYMESTQMTAWPGHLTTQSSRTEFR